MAPFAAGSCYCVTVQRTFWWSKCISEQWLVYFKKQPTLVKQAVWNKELWNKSVSCSSIQHPFKPTGWPVLDTTSHVSAVGSPLPGPSPPFTLANLYFIMIVIWPLSCSYSSSLSILCTKRTSSVICCPEIPDYLQLCVNNCCAVPHTIAACYLAPCCNHCQLNNMVISDMFHFCLLWPTLRVCARACTF